MNTKWKLKWRGMFGIFAGAVLFSLIGLRGFAADTVATTGDSNAAAAATEKTLYTCGMHPWIIQDHPGNCPICGMKLLPIHQTGGSSTAGVRKILYYKSTMMAGETSPQPAKDSMGMDMVPVYASQPDASTSSAIAIDPATIQLMNLQTAEVTRGPLHRTIRIVGTVDYNETALTDVTTRFKGWIEKLDVNTTGQLVHQGDPLFEIYSPELSAVGGEYLSVLNTNSDADAAAMSKLALDKLKSFDIPDSQIAALTKAREPLPTLTMTAPADGFVIKKNIVRGQMTEAGTTLYELADLATVWVYAQVYEADLPYVQVGQEATVTLSALPDREFHGRISYIYPDVDEKTRTARVRLEFANPGYLLKPGMFVSAQLTSELGPSVVLVPDSAVLRSGEKNTVFVALPGGKFDPRTITLGQASGNDMYEVINGLQAGERIVTSGQFMLDSESQLREAIEKMRQPSAIDLNATNVSNANAMTNAPTE